MVDKIKGGLADSKTLDDIAEKHGVTLSAIESALADGIKVEQEHTSDAKVAEEIAKDHLFEDAEYYSKLKTIEKTNSKDWAKTYKASNFIEKGVCTYNDETIYLSQECLNKAIQSIKGRPVVIKHQKVTPQNMEDHAVGYVSDCGFCDQEASFYCNFLVFDDEGKEVIAKDYSVSCAYIPKAFGKGGTWHNTPYDREVTELEFTHLALVPDPRYEDAKIYENAMDDDDDDIEWITVNGSHIPIPKGANKEKAINVFFKSKEYSSKYKDYLDGQENIKWSSYSGEVFPIKEGQTKADAQDEWNKWHKEKNTEYHTEREKKYSDIKKQKEEKIKNKEKQKQEKFDTFQKEIKKYSPSFQKYLMASEYPDYRQGGYVGYSKSNRASQAELEGRLSKTEASKELGISSKKIEEILKPSEWHHTSKFYNKTNYYDIVPYKMIQEGATDKELKLYAQKRDYDEDILSDWKSQYAKMNLKTEKQNSTDNTTKETYNMEKIEVEQGFLASLIELAQKPFMNSKKEEVKEEPKEKEDAKVDDDELEYEGKKYSKKELVNAYEAKCNAESEGVKGLKKFVKEEEEEEEHKEEEKKNSTTDEDMEFFNSMQKLMATAQTDASDKVEVPNQSKGLELGSKAFG